MNRFTFLFLFWCCLTGLSLAQRPGVIPPIGSTGEDTIPQGIMPLDTPFPMTYVLIEDPDRLFSYRDTFEWENTQHFPLRFDQAHLGNLGSAYRPLTPFIEPHPGFQTGWFQYDPYYLHHDGFRYYNQDIPVSKIKYSQAGQEDTYLTLDFGRSFANGLSLAVVYLRSNQIGEFAHQRQKNTGFGVGVWHNAPSGKYDAFYNFISNGIVAEENGGITAPELIGNDLYPDPSIPVNISDGITNHKHRSFLTKQIFHIASDTSQFGMDLWVQGQYKVGLFKYVDENTSMVEEYYGSAYLLDDRGIRQYTYLQETQGSAGISLPWKAAHSTVHSSLRYRSIQLDQEPSQRKIKELYLDVAGEFQWIEPLKLRGRLSLGLGQADGTFSFRADGDLKTGIFGHLLGHWSILSRNPYMVESSLYVNQLPVYNVAYRNPLVSEVGVTWALEKQNLEAGVKWLVYDNYIYFDTLAMPKQISGSFSFQQFFISKAFDFRWIGMKGHVIWQPDARAELAIPEWLYTASLYSRIKFFDKKVTVMPGVDVRYHDGFRGISYFPVNGTYYFTEGDSIPDYFRVDVGFGLQIRFLKAFVRLEDIGGLFKDRALYQADYYPHYRGYLRIGIEAGFFN